MKKHNHSSDDRLIQYRGKYSRHSRGQALTNFASDRHTGATCLKPSRRTIEPLTPRRRPRLFVLELNAGRIHSMNTDGSDRKTIVSDCHLPDGIVVDVEAGHIYWTNMGIPNLNDGSIERADIDGKNRKMIVAAGKHPHSEADHSR